jgi:pimeloyl-ACP methyl ester carboxylesterase
MPRSSASERDLPETWKAGHGRACWFDAAGEAAAGGVPAEFAVSWTEWDDILPALGHHYTVVAPDLPGAGVVGCGDSRVDPSYVLGLKLNMASLLLPRLAES